MPNPQVILIPLPPPPSPSHDPEGTTSFENVLFLAALPNTCYSLRGWCGLYVFHSTGQQSALFSIKPKAIKVISILKKKNDPRLNSLKSPTVSQVQQLTHSWRLDNVYDYGTLGRAEWGYEQAKSLNSVACLNGIFIFFKRFSKWYQLHFLVLIPSRSDQHFSTLSLSLATLTWPWTSTETFM